MPTSGELVQPLRPGLVPVPAWPQDGVCRICRSGCEPQYRQCYPCLEAERSVGAPEVLPIAMSIDQELLHHHLRGYKDSRSGRTRDQMALRLAGLVSMFLRHHRTCIGEFDSVTAVPSSQRLALQPVLRRVASLAGVHHQALNSSGPGIKENLATERFEVTRQVRGERVLLIDDTFTRGRSLFSAAGALRDAEAHVVGPLVIGRHVQPTFHTTQPLLKWLTGRSWDELRCCRCDGERSDGSEHRLFDP